MAIDFEDRPDGIRHIRLSGRMDIVGTGEIETRLASLASTGAQRIVLDLTAVTFLASIGIRAIITNAKAQQQRGGHLHLWVGDNEAVAKTLESTGIAVLVPMHREWDDALRALVPT
jgi:anti-sigma B factor antagonist